ncbi:MAG TPA: hypothetical protein PK764_14855 [Deltaproteobacteria bacterium]|nr:hypothetical protein [Deltaproteobacteria bacterium]
MKKGFIIVCVTFLFSLSCTLALASNRDLDAVLTSAESLFKAMQLKDYAGIWAGLSGESRDTIVGDTWKALKSSPGTYTEALVGDDFMRGDALARAYWDAYLKHFDPVMILEDSTWEMGELKDDSAQITITYKKAQKPATLHMVREEGRWKVGLTESFWSRK